MPNNPLVLTRADKHDFCVTSSEQFGIFITPYEAWMYHRDLDNYDDARLDEEVEFLAHLWEK